MYNFIFDADSLIKLTYSEVITKACEAFNCVTTDEVKREVVDEGKKRLYSDADIIEALIESKLLKIKNPEKPGKQQDNLGKGETSVLALGKELKNCIIISDDQTFINKLDDEKLPFLVPADLILLLKNDKAIDRKTAMEHLEKIKIFIRDSHYNRIKKELEGK